MSGKSRKTAPGTTTPATKSEGTSEPAKSNADLQNELYQGNYEGFYGSTIGGKAWDLVSDNLSPDKIDGYASDAFGSAGSWLGGLAEEHAEPGDLEAAKAFSKHLESSFSEGFGQRFADTNISEGIYDFVGNNPWSLLAGGAAGLGAAYAADVDLDFDTGIGLGKNWDLNLGADMGSAQDIGLDAARAGIEFDNKRTKLGLDGEYRFDNGNYNANLYGQHRFDGGGLLKGNLGHAHKDGVNTTSGALSFHQPGSFWAGIDGSHVTGMGDSTSQVNGKIRTDWGKENPWSLEAGAGWHSDRGHNAYGKASYNPSKNFSFDAGVSHSEEQGAAATLGLSYKF